MIKSLNHLPHPHDNALVLASHFTDLAPPLNARQAELESARCLYCYDAPCVNACPSDIDIPSFIRNIQQENVQRSAQNRPEVRVVTQIETALFRPFFLLRRVLHPRQDRKSVV